VERILFGDNQFFGVNHMSEDKARAQAMQFKDAKAMMRTLDVAYDAGIKVFMCTTHDKVGDIADIVRANPQRYRDFEFYPCMPYAHKYANSVGEVGILETVKRFATGSMMDMMVQGAMLALTQDLNRLMRLLVDAEMKRFQGVKTPIVFIQNVVTDLLLGLGLYDMFPAFAEHVREKYNAEAGFITMNMPALVDALERVGVRNPIVCANINKIGFRMCGGIDTYTELLSSGRCRAIAMSVLASGAIPPREAFEWVCGLKGLHSIVFGASSAGNIRQSKALIDQAWGLGQPPAAARAG
jgi:hypothetical protein